MKPRIILRIILAAAALLSATSLPSEAQISVDINQITCGDWLGYSPSNREFVRFWVSGYYNAAANSSVLDYNRLQKNSAKVERYCKKNKAKNLPTAIRDAAS